MALESSSGELERQKRKRALMALSNHIFERLFSSKNSEPIPILKTKPQAVGSVCMLAVQSKSFAYNCPTCWPSEIKPVLASGIPLNW